MTPPFPPEQWESTLQQSGLGAEQSSCARVRRAGEEIRERRSPAPLESSPLRLLPSFLNIILRGEDGASLHTGHRYIRYMCVRGA
ncbi:hypothetical protein F2P79_022404 [Pimephales promelas]|nr:hypothetical protein F2P79_022404 [Pimephales promelas]